MKSKIFKIVLGIGVLFLVSGCCGRLQSPYVCNSSSSKQLNTYSTQQTNRCIKQQTTPCSTQQTNSCMKQQTTSCATQKVVYVPQTTKVHKKKSCEPYCCYAYGVDGRCVSW